MRDPHIRVRAPNKPPLTARASIVGDYNPVHAILGTKHDDAAAKAALAVQALVDQGMVSDYSQIAFLLFSAKEGARSAGPYIQALRALDIPVYNPRSNQAHKD
jgi:hypothetical protein